VGVQEARWDRGGTARAGEYTFLYEKRKENHELGTGSFVHKRIISTVKKVEVKLQDVIHNTKSSLV
jgi:hypothetical protein